MRLVVVLGALLAAAAGFWASGGTVAVTRSGANAARLALLPSPWYLGALILAAVLAALIWRRRLTPARVLPLFAAVILLLPWCPGRIPPVFLLWAGPARLWLWIAIAVGLWVSRPTRTIPFRPSTWLTQPARASLVAALLAVALSGLASHTIASQLPNGDEPHYLVITQSLLLNHTLQIGSIFRHHNYRAYWSGPLKPDYLRRGVNGHIYSIHAPGLPVLILPAFALFGYQGVTVFLILLAGLGSLFVWRVAYALSEDAVAAWFGWAAVVLSIPYFFETFTIFPDGPAGVIVLLSVLPLIEAAAAPEHRAGLGRAWSLDGPGDVWRWGLRGALLAALPWLHSRYTVVAAAFAVCLLVEIVRRPGAVRRAAAFLTVPVISAIGWFGYFWIIYGTPSPTAPWQVELAVGNLARGIPGLLFDQQFGLLPNAPVYLFAMLGMATLWKRSRRLVIQLLVIQVPYILVVGAFWIWWGGFSAPARFLVPVILPMAVPTALLFARARHQTTRALGLLALWFSLGLTAAFALVDGGRMVFNPRNGFARWLRWMSPSLNLPRALPSLFSTYPPAIREVLAQAGVWLAAIALVGLILALTERRFGRSGLAAVLPVSGAIAGMIAVPLVWQMNQARRSTAAPAQIALLRAYRPGGHQLALDYRPFHRMPADTLLSHLRIGPTLGDFPPRSKPLVAIYFPPAGVYQLDVGSWRRGSGTVTLAIDSALPPILTIDLASLRGSDVRREFRLPVTPRGLVIDADAAARRNLDHVWLRPLRKMPRTDPLHAVVPRRSVRSGHGLLFLLYGKGYVQPGGAWVEGGGRSAEFVLAPDAGGPIQLVLHNVPVANDVTLTSGPWQKTVHLAPDETRTVDVPRLDDSLGAQVGISTSAGFRPYLADSASHDHRFLGCWITLK